MSCIYVPQNSYESPNFFDREKFIEGLQSRNGLYMMYNRELYDNHKEIIEFADVLNMPMYFLLQSCIHPEVHKRFFHELDRDLQKLLLSLKVISKKREAVRSKHPIYHHFQTVNIAGPMMETIELECNLTPRSDINYGQVLTNVANSNPTGLEGFHIEWNGYGDLTGEFTINITIDL